MENTAFGLHFKCFSSTMDPSGIDLQWLKAAALSKAPPLLPVLEGREEGGGSGGIEWEHLQ